MKRMHVVHYIVLLAILLVGIGAFFSVAPDRNVQFIIGVLTSVAYALWGIIHHAVQKDLNQRIVIEYILIGAIAIVLLATLVKPI